MPTLTLGMYSRRQVRLDLQFAVVDQFERGLAGAEHFPGLHRPPGHLAGERGGGAGLAESGAGQAQVALGSGHRGPVGGVGGFSLLGGLFGDAVLGQEGLVTLVVPLGLLDLGLGLGQLGLGRLDRQQQLVLVLGAQDRPGRHPVALLDGNPGDPAGDLGLQLGPVHRQQGAGERHGAPEIPGFHRGHRDRDDPCLLGSLLVAQLPVALQAVVEGGAGDGRPRRGPGWRSAWYGS